MIELFLLFFALCFITVPWASGLFMLAAIGTVALKNYHRRKELEQLRKDLGDLTGRSSHDVAALRRQVEVQAEQLTALRTAISKTAPSSESEAKHAVAEEKKERKAEAQPTEAPPAVIFKDAEPAKPAPVQSPVAGQPLHIPPPPPVAAPVAARQEVAAAFESQKAKEDGKPALASPPIAAQAPSKFPVPPPPPPPAQTPPATPSASANFEARIHEAQKQAATRQRPVVAPLTNMAAAGKPPLSAQDRVKSVFALEEMLGTNWFAKVGIVLLVFGIALYGLYEFNNLGAAGKITLSYLAGAILLGVGIYGERYERYQLLARTAIGGGWALLFFTTFALQYVPAMRLLHSYVADSVLMFAVAVAMVVHTLRYRSQLVTGMAFLLAYGTISLSQNTVYSLIAGAILALGIVILVQRMRWFELEVFGILASYLAHFFWLYSPAVLGPNGAQGKMFPDFYPSTAIVLFYWAIYRASYVWRKIESARDEHISSIAALLNTVLLLAVMKFQSAHADLAFYALLVLGALEFGLGQLPITRRRRMAFILLTTLGTALMVIAVPIKYTGWNIALPWLAGAEVLLLLGVFSRELVFRRLGMLIGSLVACQMALYQLSPLIAARGWPIHDTAAGMPADVLLFLVTGLIFYANYVLAAGYWSEFFEDKNDIFLARLHSYAGYAALVVGIWAYLNPAWTLVGWMALAAAFAFAGRKLSEGHASAQSALLSLAGLLWAIMTNLQLPLDAAVNHPYLTVPSFCLAAGLSYLAAWLIWFNNDQLKSSARFSAASIGTALLWILIGQKVDFVWQAGILLLLAAALAEAGVRLQYRPLAFHVHALALWVVCADVLGGYSGQSAWHGIQARWFTPIFAAILLYWLAKRAADAAQQVAPFIRGAYTWAAAIVVSMLIWHELQPQPYWIAVAWLAYGIALTLVGRRIKLASLCQQEWALAALAAIRVVATFDDSTPYYGHVSLRLITICLVAMGLYLASRRSYVVASENNRWIAYSHTWAATILLAVLACKESSNEWLAAILAVFALVLALADRYFETVELKWQCHGLAVAAMAFVAANDVPRMQAVHGFTAPFIASLVVALSFYLLATLLRFTEEQRQNNVQHVYTWPASMLAAALIWYGVTPIGVAIGWALFGVVLFWPGLHYRIAQLRMQGYVALIAAFLRIFVVDLTGSPLTAGMVVVILYFVHITLKNESDLKTESSLKMSSLLSYLGTIAVAALCYFQVHAERAPVAWAMMILLLLTAATFLRTAAYLQQAVLLTVGILFYGFTYSLAGLWSSVDDPWMQRAAPLGIAIAILLSCLPFAYRLRQVGEKSSPVGSLPRVMRRPEQVLFFSAVLLVSAMIFHWGSGFVTLGWGVEGVVIFVAALSLKERSFRLSGMVLLLLCILKIVAHDAWVLAPQFRYLTFIVLGAACVGVSFLYNRYREKFRELL